MVLAPLHLGTDQIQHADHPPMLITMGHYKPTIITGTTVGPMPIYIYRPSLSQSTVDWMCSRISTRILLTLSRIFMYIIITSSHHMEKTVADLQRPLFLRKIKLVLYITKNYYITTVQFPMPWRSDCIMIKYILITPKSV